jgi:hypothetical protein
MKPTVLFIALPLLVFLCTDLRAQVPPEQLVPLPGDFAEYRPEFSTFLQNMIGEIGGRTEESYGTGMGRLSYESAGAEVRVYTTTLPIEEVRERYFELFADALLAQGAPPDAIPQFRDYLDGDIIEEIESDPMVHADPSIIEEYLRAAGAETALQWVECYRELHPGLTGMRGRTFLITLDELTGRRPDAAEAPEEYTLVEVEVQQPFIDPVACRVDDGTAITYSVFRMVASDE